MEDSSIITLYHERNEQAIEESSKKYRSYCLKTAYYSNLYTYKFSSERDVTMTLTSNIDVYLYIIDPYSSEAIVAANNTNPNLTKETPNLYNDDYTNVQTSQITKTFTAGKSYLIIFAMYNPSSNNGNTFTLTVN